MNKYNILIWGYAFVGITARNPVDAARIALAQYNENPPDGFPVSFTNDISHIIYQIDDGSWHEWRGFIPKTWDELTRQERKKVMKNCREEWIEDCQWEIDHCKDDGGLLETMEMLTASNNPYIVYDMLTDESPEDLMRFYA